MAFIAPLAFGTAATATTAATAGLFGSAGAFGLGTTLATVGTGLGIAGALKAGQATSDAADYNAQTSMIEAQAEETRRRAQAKQQMGALRASIAKSGATSEGTPLLAITESAANAEIDALNAQWSGSRQAQAMLMRGKAARTESYFRAGTSLMSGLSRVM
jgi:hypothetical protein